MAFALPLTGLVTLAMIAVFFWTGINEARSRQKHQCPPPALDGPEELRRYMRVRGNTMESLLMAYPALWLFAVCWGDLVAAVIGLVYVIGRILYARGYYQDPKKRSLGFGIGFLATAALWLGAFIGLAMQAASL